jgi:transposase
MLRSQARGTADIHGQPVLCAGRRARASPPSLRSTSAVTARYRAGANRSLLNPSRLSVRSTRILNSRHKAFLARIVDEGPIPAIHGVVRWRACDLIMRLYEEFGLSVSDDTIYRALKNLGFSHVSARPKAYKQNAEVMEAFKKTSPSVWRKSARSLHPAHR